jgi:VWFA-related protein
MKHQVLAAIVVVSTSAVLAAPSSAPRFAGTAEVTVVEIPVQVARNGQPVRGLTRDDFEVSTGGARVPVVDFEVVDLAAQLPGGSVGGVPLAARRHFLFLFDLAFSEPKSVGKAQEAALEILRGSLHPSDLAAVAFYQPTGLQVSLGFTSDRDQVARAIRNIGSPAQFNRSPDPLGLTAASTVNELDGFFGSAAGSTLPGVMRMADSQEDTPQDLARMTVRGERGREVEQIVDLTRAFSELAGLLGSIEGRKHVLYLSQGFSNRALVGEGTTVQDSVAIEGGNLFRVDNDQRFGSSRAQNGVETMLEAFRRADSVIHAVDLAGARAGGDIRGNGAAAGLAGNKDSLVAMAQSTGGTFYDDFNDLGAAFGQLVERTGVTYLLSIQPPDLRSDGKFHRLRVKVVDGVEGGTVTHRPGFFAPDSDARTSPLAQRFARAEKILSGDDGGAIAAAALALPFRLPEQPAYVPVVVEVDGTSLLASAGEDLLETALYVYALGENGEVLDYFVQQVAFDLTKVRAAIESAGVKFFGHLDLPPGRHVLRVLVENEATGQDSLASLDLEVPASSSETPFLLPPLFPEPPGRWLVVREGLEQQRERPVPYPFFAGEVPYLPAAAPRVQAGGPLEFQITGQGLGTDLDVTATVHDFATGEPRSTGPLAFGERRPGLGETFHLAARLGAPDLAPGHYVLELTVIDRTTGLRVASSAEFEVVRAGDRVGAGD